MKGWIVLLTSFFINAATSSAFSAGIFHPATTTLSNGLQVVVIQNHLAPVVSISLIYKVGTADDPVEMHGLSHFLEHLMFKGTPTHPAGDFDKFLEAKGTIVNAATWKDYTFYYVTLPKEINRADLFLSKLHLLNNH